MYFLLEKVDFHCYVSLLEGKLTYSVTTLLFVTPFKADHPIVIAMNFPVSERVSIRETL